MVLLGTGRFSNISLSLHPPKHTKVPFHWLVGSFVGLWLAWFCTILWGTNTAVLQLYVQTLQGPSTTHLIIFPLKLRQGGEFWTQGLRSLLYDDRLDNGHVKMLLERQKETESETELKRRTNISVVRYKAHELFSLSKKINCSLSHEAESEETTCRGGFSTLFPEWPSGRSSLEKGKPLRWLAT